MTIRWRSYISHGVKHYGGSAFKSDLAGSIVRLVEIEELGKRKEIE